MDSNVSQYFPARVSSQTGTTANTFSGRVTITNPATTATVTNSLVTAASHILCQQSCTGGVAAPAILHCVPGNGSFVITLSAAPTGGSPQTIDWLVINPQS